MDGLDPVMRRQVWSLLLGDVAERGTTVLVSSHNLRELEDVCDHVGIMNQGKVLLERSLSELQDTTVKLQVVYPGEEPRLPAELNILHHSAVGRVHPPGRPGEYPEPDADHRSPAAGGHSPDAGGDLYL